MSEKCNPNYRNLHTVKSYGEQKQATVQWSDQVCANDEYLKQEVDELNYRSPARIRKRWRPILVDDQNSYGYTVNPNKTVSFSELLSDNVTIDFNDFSKIDLDRSDCAFTTYTDRNGVIHKSATIPMKQISTLDTSCRDYDPSLEVINSFWYCGFDKNKPYTVRPDWIKDWKDSEIPSVCRAQTITIPPGISNGVFESVDLRIENNGVTNSNWGSPLYVQLWRTEPVRVEKTYWNESKKRGDSYNPPQYETIYYPVGGPEGALATAVFEPNRITPGLQNLKFDKGVTVNSGEHYAIVMLSPLSHWEHCPRVGGWGRNCAVDKYEGGDAFLSEDNGQTWQRYGKMDYTVNQYRLGAYTPMDFCFIGHIRKYSSGYDTNEDFYLYLKPIHSNPIKSIQLVPIGYGNKAQESAINMEFQVSKSGRAGSWVTLDANELSINFNRDPATGEYPHFAFIRVKMKTTDSTKAPYLDSLKVIYEMDSPKEMYVRTIKYNPKTSPMLGASAWSKFYSRFETDPQVSGSVELISEKIGIEHFSIITAQELEKYTYIEGLDDEKITDLDLSVRYDYLMNDANALNILRRNKIYVKPYTYMKNGNKITHPMSFNEGIKFDNSPSYPIISAELNPYGNANEIPLAEWIDYSFDYDNDQLIFNQIMNQYTINGNLVNETIEEYLPVGTLEVAYHPIFIQNLSSEDVGIREDSEGFVLDYFKEEHIINEEDVENRYVSIKFPSCDPILSLVIDDKEYIEGIHFTVDYLHRRIEFPIIDIENSATLLTENFGKEIYVVYTPNLEDPGLIIAYRGVRKDTSKQMRIYENYIEYKV